MEHGSPTYLIRLLNAATPAEKTRAWKKLLERHSNLLLHTARHMAEDQDAAMDRYAFILEQLRADNYRRLRAYQDDGRTRFTTWLVVVARRLCVDYSRSKYGRPHRTEAQQAKDSAVVRKRLTELVAAEINPGQLMEAANPESLYLLAEWREQIRLALESLNPTDRLILSLRYEEGASALEIKRVMGFRSTFFVYRRIRLLIEEIRERLTRLGVDREPPDYES